MAKKCTLNDVAMRMGVSTATVSRALANHEQIALKTREKVRMVALEMGYIPNRAAQSLASGRSGFVGVVMPLRGRGLGDPFLGEFLEAVTAGLGDKGIDLVMAAVPREGSELRQMRSLITSGRVDGLVISRIEEQDARIALLKKFDMPFVTHGRLLNDTTSYSWIDTDGTTAFAQAFDILYDFGHRSFGMLTIDEPMTFRKLREKGLRDAMALRGDPEVTLRTIQVPRFDRTKRATMIGHSLDFDDRPTAFIAMFDGLAIDMLEQAQRRGLSVPEDLSVIGFDNTPPAAYAVPGLTTFDSRIGDCGTLIAEMMLNRILGPKNLPHESRLIKPELVLRASHGPVPRRATRAA